MMSEEKHVFNDRPLTEERLAEMKAVAEGLLQDIDAKLDQPVAETR